MKRCPSCGEWNDDTAQRCWQCREVFDEITALRGKTPVEPVVEKKGKSGTVKWQTRLGEIWKENTVSIIITIISIALIFYAIVQKPHVDEITPPKIAAPAANPVLSAPPPQPALTSESEAASSAYELFKKALELCPGEKCTDTQKAIEYLDDAIKLKPNFAGAYNNRGNAYCDLVQYKRAIEDYNVAINLNPDFANAFVNRGNAYLSSGNKELGCSDVKKACDLGLCPALEAAKKKGACP